MSGPLLLIVGPLLPAAVIFVGLRRWPRAAAVCGFLSALLLRFLIAAVDLQPAAGAEGAFLGGDEFIFLGRSLLLTGIFLGSGANSLAVLEDLTHRGYFVRLGQQIGNARLVEILPQAAVFEVSEYGASRRVVLRLERTEESR